MPHTESNELSDRELELLKLVATGASNKEIAQKLYISSNTVKVHLRNIFSKIGVTSRTEAAMYAVHIGLVKTASAEQISPEEVSPYTDNPEISLAQSDTIPETSLKPEIVKSNKRNIRIIEIFSILLLILISIGLVLTRGNIIPPSTPIPPTSTPREQWHELTGLPTPRRGLAVTSYENQIYTIGGESVQGISNFVERYNPQTNLWTSLPSKPTPVTDISAAIISGRIYVPGGQLASGKPTDKTEIFDPNLNQWTTGIPLPKPLSAYSLAVFEGRMYLFGGWDGNRIVNNTYIFDPNNNSWNEIAPMPTARSYAGAVVVGGKIYVIGGWDGQNALTVNEVFQPDYSGIGSQWVQASPLPFGRYGMGITNLADIIFIIGGTGPDDNLTMIALSPEDPDWGQLEAPLQKGWSFLGAVTVGTRLYALGGGTEEGLINQMWSYQAIFTITLPIVR